MRLSVGRTGGRRARCAIVEVLSVKGHGMDLGALTALAGNALVNATVTDAFEGVRAKIARLFGRGKPDPGTERRLDETRQQLLAVPPEQAASALEEQARQWQTRFADLLADHPEAEAGLRALVAGLQAVLPDAGGNVTNTISGTVKHGPVLMGRDFGDVTIGPPPTESLSRARTIFLSLPWDKIGQNKRKNGQK